MICSNCGNQTNEQFGVNGRWMRPSVTGIEWHVWGMLSPRALPFYGNCVLSFQQNEEKGANFVSASEKPSDAPLRNGLAILRSVQSRAQRPFPAR